jgi:hypothetical protein
MSSLFERTSFGQFTAEHLMRGTEVTWGGHGVSIISTPPRERTFEDVFTLFWEDIAQAIRGIEALYETREPAYEAEIVSSTALSRLASLRHSVTSSPAEWDYTDEEFSALF